FSFDYVKRRRQIGPLFGGLGITAITYFMLIKGVSGTSFNTPEVAMYIESHICSTVLYSFLSWTLLLFLVNRLFRVNILQVMVLVGTFALAMAFAGNDLVNFIGVPLAAFNSFEIFKDSGMSANELLMTGLAGKVPTPTILLLLAGIIM